MAEIDVARRADTKTGTFRPLSELAYTIISAQPKIADVVFPARSSEPTVGYRKMWLRIAKQGDLPADSLRMCCATASSTATDLGYSEPTITSLNPPSATTMLMTSEQA